MVSKPKLRRSNEDERPPIAVPVCDASCRLDERTLVERSVSAISTARVR